MEIGRIIAWDKHARIPPILRSIRKNDIVFSTTPSVFEQGAGEPSQIILQRAHPHCRASRNNCERELNCAIAVDRVYVRGRAKHDACNRKQRHDALGGGRMGL